MTTTTTTATRVGLDRLAKRPEQVAMVPYEKVTTLLPATPHLVSEVVRYHQDVMADLQQRGLPDAQYLGIDSRINDLTVIEGEKIDLWRERITDENIDELLSIMPAANRWDLEQAVAIHPELARLKTTVGYDVSKARSAELRRMIAAGKVVGPHDFHPAVDLAPVRAQLRQAGNVAADVATSPITHEILKLAGASVIVLGTVLFYSMLLAVNAVAMDPAIFVEVPIDDSRALICAITRWS